MIDLTASAAAAAPGNESWRTAVRLVLLVAALACCLAATWQGTQARAVELAMLMCGATATISAAWGLWRLRQDNSAIGRLQWPLGLSAGCVALLVLLESVAT